MADCDPSALTPADGRMAYHQAELAIALSSTDRRRVLPDVPAGCTSVLDIGCGAGQTLIGSNLRLGVRTCGVDIDEEALVYGRHIAPSIRFIRASGERLPFADETFEMIVSRVALPYMHVPHALEEVRRVLVPGGRFWCALHPFSIYCRRILKGLTAPDVKDLAYLMYILANGLLFHCTRRQFRFPGNRSRCESFQTASGMRRALRASGFDVVSISTEPFLAMTAVKRGRFARLQAG
jgi:SAM-dependent methyltransferase